MWNALLVLWLIGLRAEAKRFAAERDRLSNN